MCHDLLLIRFQWTHAQPHCQAFICSAAHVPFSLLFLFLLSMDSQVQSWSSPLTLSLLNCCPRLAIKDTLRLTASGGSLLPGQKGHLPATGQGWKGLHHGAQHKGAMPPKPDGKSFPTRNSTLYSTDKQKAFPTLPVT